MQFIVPQFIDVEQKIIGPLSLRQFFTLLLGGIAVAIEWRYSDLALLIILALPTVIICVSLAFVQINGSPLHYFLLNFVSIFTKPLLRVWSKNYKIKTKEVSRPVKADKTPTLPTRPMITHQRISELALVVDTGGAYQQEPSLPPESPPIDVAPAAEIKT